MTVQRIRSATRLALVFAALVHVASARADAQSTSDPADPPDAKIEAADDDASAFFLRPHRKNYFLFITKTDEPVQNPALGFGVDAEEVKFQLSVRYDLWSSNRSRLAFAYTNLSFWQIYNWDESSPFRTTDHEPELFFERDGRRKLRRFRIAATHESNGEGGTLSRSWNRLVVEVLFYHPDSGPWDRPFRKLPKIPSAEREGWLEEVKKDRYWRISVKAWENVQHDEVGNPDIDQYMGLLELSGDLVVGRHQVSVMLRHSLGLFEGRRRGAAQVEYSVGFTNRVRGIVQFFNGYGESLLDYNQNTKRLGFGFELSP